MAQFLPWRTRNNLGSKHETHRYSWIVSNHLIILTCTVEPSKDVLVTRNNADLRLKDYEVAILKWIEIAKANNHKILVLENSSNIHAIENLLKVVNYPHIYYLASSKDEVSQNEGISAGEFGMLRDALPLVQSFQDIKFCWKVTGRLFVENFEKIRKSNSADVAVNRFYSPLHIIDSRIVGFSVEVFRDLVSAKPKFRKYNQEMPLESKPDTFSSLEEFLTFFLTQRECVGLQVGTMKKIPVFSGTSASTNKRLNSKRLSLKLQILNTIRPIVLKLLGGSAP